MAKTKAAESKVTAAAKKYMKPSEVATFGIGLFGVALLTRTPIISSQIAPTKPAIRNTTSTMCEREAESKPFPLNAKSAKKVVV